MEKNFCVGRESNPDQLLGRQLCSPLYHQRMLKFKYNIPAIKETYNFSNAKIIYVMCFRNKLTILDPKEYLCRIASRPGAHNLRCLFRVNFVPIDAYELLRKDSVAFEYLYVQCCNDVTQVGCTCITEYICMNIRTK